MNDLAQNPVDSYQRFVPVKKTKAKKPSTTDSYTRVALSQIDLEDKTFCFRCSLNISSLVLDMKKNGQDFPIMLRRIDRKEKLQIVCGFRRVAALQELQVKEVKARILSLSYDEALRLSWSENEQRRSYSSLDKANAILSANRAGKTFDELQSLFSLKRSQLFRLKKLVTIPDVLSKALEEEKITTTHALALNELFNKYSDLDLEYWIREIEQNNLSVRQLRYRIGRQHRADKRTEPLFVEEDGRIQFRAITLSIEKLSNKEKEELRSLGERLLKLSAGQ